MDEFSVAAVNGDSGLVVTEQLQTLTVACRASDGVSSSEAQPDLQEGGESLRHAEASPAEGHAGFAEQQEAAPNGGDSEERISQPDPCHGLLEQPEPGSKGALLEGKPAGSAPSSAPSDCVWPRVRAVAAAGEAGPGGGDGVEHQQQQTRLELESPVEGEKDKPCSEEPLDLNSSAPRLLAFNDDAGNEELSCKLVPAGPEGPAALPGGLLGKEGSAVEGSRSSSESDSESDSDTDTDSSSSVSSGLPMLPDEGADQPKKNESSPIEQKDGLSEQKLLPVEDVKIILPEFVELMSFGKVSSVIENLVIIESRKGLQPVSEDTVLFKEDHHSIGKVFEVFGPVSHPFYVLQFNSPEHIETKGIKVHDTVYFAPSVEDFTQYIFPEKLKQYKGSDASWENDDEPPPEALEYSDDEKESAAKHHKKKSQNLRKKLRSQQEESNENGTHYQSRRQYPSDGSRGCRRGERNPSFSRGCRRGEHKPGYSRGCHRGEYNPSYSRGFRRGEYNPSFSTNRFPHLSSPQCFVRQPVPPPQHYISDSTESQKLSACYPHQSQNGPGSHQYFSPPPQETVSYEANHFPPLSATWGWPSGYTQNIYDPLLSLLALPPPPPPPSPPPSPAPL